MEDDKSKEGFMSEYAKLSEQDDHIRMGFDDLRDFIDSSIQKGTILSFAECAREIGIDPKNFHSYIGGSKKCSLEKFNEIDAGVQNYIKNKELERQSQSATVDVVKREIVDATAKLFKTFKRKEFSSQYLLTLFQRGIAEGYWEGKNTCLKAIGMSPDLKRDFSEALSGKSGKDRFKMYGEAMEQFFEKQTSDTALSEDQAKILHDKLTVSPFFLDGDDVLPKGSFPAQDIIQAQTEEEKNFVDIADEKPYQQIGADVGDEKKENIDEKSVLVKKLNDLYSKGIQEKHWHSLNTCIKKCGLNVDPSTLLRALKGIKTTERRLHFFSDKLQSYFDSAPQSESLTAKQDKAQKISQPQLDELLVSTTESKETGRVFIEESKKSLIEDERAQELDEKQSLTAYLNTLYSRGIEEKHWFSVQSCIDKCGLQVTRSMLARALKGEKIIVENMKNISKTIGSFFKSLDEGEKGADKAEYKDAKSEDQIKIKMLSSFVKKFYKQGIQEGHWKSQQSCIDKCSLDIYPSLLTRAMEGQGIGVNRIQSIADKIEAFLKPIARIEQIQPSQEVSLAPISREIKEAIVSTVGLKETAVMPIEAVGDQREQSIMKIGELFLSLTSLLASQNEVVKTPSTQSVELKLDLISARVQEIEKGLQVLSKFVTEASSVRRSVTSKDSDEKLDKIEKKIEELTAFLQPRLNISKDTNSIPNGEKVKKALEIKNLVRKFIEAFEIFKNGTPADRDILRSSVSKPDMHFLGTLLTMIGDEGQFKLWKEYSHF